MKLYKNIFGEIFSVEIISNIKKSIFGDYVYGIYYVKDKGKTFWNKGKFRIKNFIN